MLRKPLIAIATLAVLFTTPAPAQLSPLDTFITQKMSETGTSGLGAAILVDRKVVWMKGYGFADRQRKVPFTPDTIMNIGSIAKTFTGVAMMQLVQSGKLSLDEDINKYLPFRVVNPHHPDAKITLRHLATHTSGITDRWDVYKESYHYGGDSPEALGDILEGYFVPGGKDYAKENFLDAAPGTNRDYSNIGAGLAGYIVERAAGKKLNEITRQSIFKPLGMNSTGWFLSEVDRAKHSVLYVVHDDMTIPIQLYGNTTYPDGGVRTSVADLSKFFIALLSGGAYKGKRILDEKSAAEMTRFQFTAENKPQNVSLDEVNSGLFWATKYNVTRIGHNGTDPGVRTEMLASLDRGVGVILFSNTSLAGEAARQHNAIFQELWKQAEAMRDATPGRS